MPRSAQSRRRVTSVAVAQSSEPLDLHDLASVLARALLAGGGAPPSAEPGDSATTPSRERESERLTNRTPKRPTTASQRTSRASRRLAGTGRSRRSPATAP
jgi:hypothetical protein